MSQAGKILLNAVDIYTYYGVFAVRGSLNDLVKLPDMKPVSEYSWPSEHGDDVELTNRVIQARDIKLTFLLSGSSIADMWSKRDALLAVLTSDGWHTLEFDTLSRIFEVYYKSCESAKFINSGKKRIEMVLVFRLNVAEGESTPV